MMDSEVKEALDGIRRAWKNMLTAKDKETFDAWSKEQKRLDKILYREKRKPRKYVSPTERQLKRQQYQHEYYLRVTKPKRAERRKK